MNLIIKKENFLPFLVLFFCVCIFILFFSPFVEKDNSSELQPLSYQAEKDLSFFIGNGDCKEFFSAINDSPNIKFGESEINFKNSCIVKARKDVLSEAKKKASYGDFSEAILLIEEFLTLTNEEDKLLNDFKGMYLEFKNQLVSDLVKYDGPVNHIFFHSLIIYPERVFDGSYEALSHHYWRVTTSEFKKILEELYERNFILIDIETLIEKDPLTGNIKQKPIFLPKEKKPLIISVDDVNYLFYGRSDGFARKLVLDDNDLIATLVDDPNGGTEITRDGDVMPILDDFILSHPDFSLLGKKGIIALTGFGGVLGYKTYNKNIKNYSDEVKNAKRMVGELSLTGWKFANHSYSHKTLFKNDEVDEDFLKEDLEKWHSEVSTIIGETKIFIGPFGQIFSHNDPRRNLLIENDYNILCGVDIESPLYFYKNYFVSDRINIDGYRMINNTSYLSKFFDVGEVYDKSRPVDIND